MIFVGFATLALAYPIQRARRDLVEAVDEKVELVSTVAHELRGPLTSTRAYIELIRDGAAGEVNERQQSMLDRAMRSATRMEQLIGLFLNVERAENDRVKPVLESVDLASVARDMTDSMAPLAADREITIELHNVDVLPSVQGERQSTDQVLANLLSNAVKFSPDSSAIIVAGYLEAGQAGLTVSDRGVGISSEDQKHIFQRFYRSEDPRKRRVRGTGLGLYVSRRLMEKMGGHIWFKSIPGDGSTFGFSLPAEPRASASGNRPPEELAEEATLHRPSEASA
jgi:signal transduction histidine kinase